MMIDECTMLRPKFAIGDAVFTPVVQDVPEHITCPDCLGAGKWISKSPAGDDYEIACPRCSRGWGGGTGKLALPGCKGSVRRLTIGSVRTDTAARDGEQVSYMCLETGVGSGSIYYEKITFATSEQAQAAADVMALEQRNRVHEQDYVKTNKELFARHKGSAELYTARKDASLANIALERLKDDIIELPEVSYRFSSLTEQQLRDVSLSLLPEDDEYRAERA